MGTMRSVVASRVVLLALVCVAACGDTVAVAEGQEIDAFVIAINHFDPQGVKGLRLWCDEMRFTHAALSLAAQTVPELSALHIRTGERNPATGDPRELVSLQVLHPSGRPGGGETDWDYIENFAKPFLSGCRGERVTEQSDGLKGRWHTYETWTWWPCAGANGAGASTGCNATAAARWLCAAGIQSASIESSETDSRAKSGRLFLNLESAVDLRYEAARIMALSGYEKIFGDAQLKPFTPTLEGDGDEIRVVEGEDNAGFAGITLLYSHGWGDCPAGCPQRHWWKVRIKSRGVRRGGEWDLVVDAVEESGDVLPFRMRAALCAGVSRDY